ncbi:squalene synthase HpnC [Candidatus Kapaibacterium sp.]
MKIIGNHSDILEILLPDGGRYGVDTLEQAYDFCRKVADSHYENFPVGSIIIPKEYRKHFYSVYVFSRVADDIADELTDYPAEYRVSLLNNLLNLISGFDYSGLSKKNPLAYALTATIAEKQIPFSPFEKLIKAFVTDSEFIQPIDMDYNIEYCKYSANPVGELVLRIFDNYDNTTSKFSDAICTGLQLVNFWQDVSTDYRKGRIYIPTNLLNKYEINDLFDKKAISEPKLKELLKEIYVFTENFFIFGNNLVKHIKNNRLKFEVILTLNGGLKVLTKCKALGTGILQVRPQITKFDIFSLLYKSIIDYLTYKWKR